MSSRPTALVLAAGRGVRMGADKALLDLGGKPAVVRIAEHCAEADLDVVVVRRQGAQPVPGGLSTVLVSGQGEMMDSLRSGLRSLADDLPGVLVFPVDYAMVSAGTVRAVSGALGVGTGDLVLPLFDGRPGHPIGVRAAVVPEILDPGVSTLREVIRRDPDRVRVVPVPDPWILRDLDRPEDLRAARAELSRDP